MTREELEKQDIRLNKLCFDYQEKEKRIEELENKIADIKANCDLAIEGRDIKIKELKQQIEKMKCCGNCAKRGHICVAEEMQGNLCGKNKDKWELRR
jgi:predicted RNase H-like nuclease (RuvC/YqgF family)